MGAFHQLLFFSNRPNPDQIDPDELICLIYPIVVLNRLQSSPFLTELTCWKTVAVVVLVVRGSGEGRVLTLRWHYARPSVESGRCYTKAPAGGRDKGTFRRPRSTVSDRLLFFNIMFKSSSRSLVRYPTLGGLRRLRQIFSRRYRVWLDSARRFPTIFAKMRPIDQKRDRVLSGPKHSLVKWPL